MRVYKVAGVDHKVYDPHDIVPNGMIVQADWRKGNIGDWVKADDECVIQILRKGEMLKAKGKSRTKSYIGTCTGTFPVSDKGVLDTSRRANIYSFSGRKSADEVLMDRKELSKNEGMFVSLISAGMDPQEAYMKSYPTNDPGYAKFKSGQLIKTERVRTAMKEELKPVMDELGISDSFVLKGIKDTALNGEKEDVRLRALFKLGDILDLEDKGSSKITSVTGIGFQGFTSEMLQEVKSPEIENE